MRRPEARRLKRNGHVENLLKAAAARQAQAELDLEAVQRSAMEKAEAMMREAERRAEEKAAAAAAAAGGEGPAAWHAAAAAKAVAMTNPDVARTNADVEPAVDDHRADDALQRALATLPDVERETLLLTAVDGLGYREVARVLGCSLGTVAARRCAAEMVHVAVMLSLVMEEFLVQFLARFCAKPLRLIG